ncbi:MAG: hypothetical protein IT428_28870 [Planctomycetaceae bacterium]|nr:hypothetical protein [Planctomycetaceae bacterium]
MFDRLYFRNGIMGIQANPTPCGGVPACCNGGTIQDRLKATLQVATGSTCPCVDGATIDLVLISQTATDTTWSGSGPLGTCGSTIALTLACTGNHAVFALLWNISGGNCNGISGSVPSQNSGGCGPTQSLNLTYNGPFMLNPICCNDMTMPNLYLINVIITE